VSVKISAKPFGEIFIDEVDGPVKTTVADAERGLTV
jgi:hypothetical protein